jgi:hypothetical protein
MSDFDERLRAADPAAGMSYQHPNADAMISRIEARAPLARRHVLRSFQLKMVSAVTMAAVLTVGGIAVLDGAGPALQVLTLSAAKSSSPHAPSSFGAAAVPKSGIMRIYEEFDFTAGSSLSSTAGSAPSYELSLPASPSSEAARLAAMFNVTGTPADTNGDGSDWTVTDTAGDTLDYENYGGVPQWYYNSAPSNASSITTTDGTSVAMPSNSTIDADVQGYLTQMGYGYSVTDPQYSSQTITGGNAPGQADVTTNEKTASYSVTIDGVLTDQTVDITIDSNNNVIGAHGPAFSLMPSVNYPLQSPTAGVSVLEAQQQAEFASTSSGTTDQGGSGAPLSPGSASGAPSTSPGSGPADTTTTDPGNTTTTTAPTGPPIVDVTLDTVSTSLSSYTLTDGSVWMLPLYTYTGTVTNSDGSTYTGTWTTLAVDPSYVQLPISSSGGINPGGPILY